jgi:hypothetical protein
MPDVIPCFIHIYDDKDSGLETEYNMIKSNEILTLQSLGCSSRAYSLVLESINALRIYFNGG